MLKTLRSVLLLAAALTCSLASMAAAEALYFERVQVNTGFLGGDAAKTLSAGTVIPGGKKTGMVCFDKGAGDPQEVSYTGSLFGSPSTWR